LVMQFSNRHAGNKLTIMGILFTVKQDKRKRQLYEWLNHEK
jgi:hypothetical protein